MQRHARLITMLASGCVGLVFVALLIGTIWGAATMKRASAQTLAAVTVSERYELLERQLNAEASIVRVHGFDPESSGWYEERPAAMATEATLDLINKTGETQDRAIAAATSRDHDRYIDVLLVLFSQIDNHASDVTATFKQSVQITERMIGRIDARASEQRQAAITSLADLTSKQAFIVQTISLASVLGVISLAVCVWLIAKYRHIIESTRQTELQRLAQACRTDALTGLGNHRAYQDDLERELARVGRDGSVLTLALIDIDNFKQVNDNSGHIHGDNVLSAVGNLLRELRKVDRGFRLGGDEFGVILAHTTAADALALMERVRQRAPASLSGNKLSIGLSSTEYSGLDAVVLRAQADSALYAAKRLGRNTVVTYGDACSHGLVEPNDHMPPPPDMIDERRPDVVVASIRDSR